ncbi:glycosyltransferase [Cyclobacterium roseum]|uniref:glycosyltransferase n=1 Tax=Cyclobacterium roseum TaxID=2666137 RepID=UPI001391DE78|nr:glycosyltransferase [Cyclobacterium roseum]
MNSKYLEKFHVVHLIDTLSKINFGIWNTIPKNFSCLGKIKQYILATENPNNLTNVGEIEVIVDNTFGPKCIFISHGCWKEPTITGFKRKKKGFYWLAIPHGMLEPWSMRQNKWKKLIYFNLFEKKRLNNADALIAVSSSEKRNLQSIFPNKEVIHIPNSVLSIKKIKKNEETITFLFMARLHHKKGVIPLVKAWKNSTLFNNCKYQLIIAGPDDGEQNELEKLLSISYGDLNIKLLGAVYGDSKHELLYNSHFYILPSFSEGFPSSLLEGATYGCVPIYTEGCNFSEGSAADIGILIKNDETSILNCLNSLSNWSIEKICFKGNEAKIFVDKNYSSDIIGKKILDLLSSILIA